MRAPVLVHIDALDADGVATGTDGKGRVRAVRGAPLGATVRVVGKPNSSILLEVETTASDAVKPRCPQSGTCGGCTLQDVPLARQRTEKAGMLARLLAPLGGQDHGLEGAAASDGYGYRNKVELSFGVRRYLSNAELAALPPRADDGGPSALEGRFLGFHAPGRFDRVVDAPACALVSDAMNGVLGRIRADVLDAPFAFWDARAATGFFRHLLLREGEEGVLVALYTSPGADEHAAWLSGRVSRWGAVGVAWYENAGTADAAVGVLRAVLHGTAEVHARLGAGRFRLSPGAFFQVNVPAAERLVARVAEALDGCGADTLLDLYCGAGALGLALGDRFPRVIGVELNVDAVEDARVNARASGIDATFHAGPCEKVVPALALPSRPAVVVDPPRAGLHPDALSFVAGLDAAVLVYVACRPTSLLRDGKALLAAGWRCTDRWAVDLFPQTGHVEVVARFIREDRTLIETTELPHAEQRSVAAMLALLDATLGERTSDVALQRARRWAAIAHADQVRPDGRGTPYLAHPLSVTARVARWWPDAPAHVLVAALLHDTLEDVPEGLLAVARAEGVAASDAAGAIAAVFGAEALRIVRALTNHAPAPGVDKNAAYLEHVVHTVLTDPAAGPVKLSDLHDNALSIHRLEDHAKRGKLARKYGPVLAVLAERLADVPVGHPLHAQRDARAAELRDALGTEPYCTLERP